MYDWVIWKAKVTDATVRFLHIDDLPASGFASVYQFSQADAESMDKLESYKSFKGTVHSPLLKIDCDTAEASVVVERVLKAKGIGYEKYTTGNRGFHYHIQRIVQPSHMLPAIDRAYVAENFPGADLSFYHHVGWYRQTGATHGKTGNKKALLEVVPGSVLTMNNTIPQLNSFVNSEERDGSGDIQCVFTDHTLQRLTVPYANGERRNRLCAIAAQLDRLNQPMEWAYVYLVNVDLMCEEPLGETELRRILHWAYEERDKS